MPVDWSCVLLFACGLTTLLACLCGTQSSDDVRTLRVYGAAFSAFDESKVHRLATCVSMLVRALPRLRVEAPPCFIM